MLQNTDFVLREIYGTALLMPVRRNDVGNEPIHLNEIAAVIWKKAGCCESLNCLLQSINELYELESDSSEKRAIEQFIAQLVELKLIKEES